MLLFGCHALHVGVQGSADEDQFAKRVTLEERTECTYVITIEEMWENKENRKSFIHESHDKYTFPPQLKDILL